MKTGAVVAAAGLSSRMGSFKPLLEVEGRSFVRRVVDTLLDAGAEEVVVVTGYRAEELEAHLTGSGAACIRNEAYAGTEMLDSAKLGFARLLPECGRILFTPADVPLFSAGTVRALLAAGMAEYAVPTCGEKTGHPVLLSAGTAEKVLSYAGDGGLRGALLWSGAGETRVPVEDPGCLQDADTPEEYGKLLELAHKTGAMP